MGYSAWIFWRHWPQLQQLRSASEGEKVVGQYLERLREDSYMIFHDLIGDGFNVDHVMIGPSGIYAVETKVWRKPARGDSRITFDGAKILVNGYEPDRNPVIQAKAQAKWLNELLLESTGHNFNIRPVIVFPG